MEEFWLGVVQLAIFILGVKRGYCRAQQQRQKPSPSHFPVLWNFFGSTILYLIGPIHISSQLNMQTNIGLHSQPQLLTEW